MLLEMVTLEVPFNECSGVMDIITSKENIRLPESLFKVADHATFELIAGCLIPDPFNRPSINQLIESDYFLEQENDKLVIEVTKHKNKSYKDVFHSWIST